MPSWIGPVTMGLGTVGLSTSRCEPAAGPVPEPEPATAVPAVSRPAVIATAVTARAPGRRGKSRVMSTPGRWTSYDVARGTTALVEPGPANLRRRETGSHGKLTG